MTERTITTPDGVRLRTRTDGDASAPALLLVNSLGTDLSMWDDQITLWATTHLVVRFDQRGHGGSDVPPPPYTVEQFGRDALSVIDQHGIDRADLCGISLGGLVALWIAATATQRVHRAVLADTAARIGSEETWRDRAAAVRAGGMGAVTDLVLDRFFSPGFRASGATAVAHVERTLLRTDVEGYAGSCEALAVADLRDLAPQAGVPILVVVGDEDVATPPSTAEELVRLLPDAELSSLPGAGHLANLERPEAFARLVADFLAVPARTGADPS